MYPTSFDYHRPASLAEAVGLLRDLKGGGKEAKLLAGGHSLIPAMKLRVARPAAVVDIGRLPGLSGIADDGDGLTLGALTTHADFQRLGLDRFFSFGYCAADVGARKPHPAMFEQALAHAGVAPHEAVHVGDHPVDDVRGAAGAGMASVWLNLASVAEDPGATATVHHLADVPQAIARLAA